MAVILTHEATGKKLPLQVSAAYSEALCLWWSCLYDAAANAVLCLSLLKINAEMEAESKVTKPLTMPECKEREWSNIVRIVPSYNSENSTEMSKR